MIVSTSLASEGYELMPSAPDVGLRLINYLPSNNLQSLNETKTLLYVACRPSLLSSHLVTFVIIFSSGAPSFLSLNEGHIGADNAVVVNRMTTVD